MSKNKAKIVTQKKKVNFASIMKFVRTLWRNDSVVEVATTTKWWWSIIIFVLSLVISVLPATISQAQAQGSNFVGATNVNYSDPFYNGLYAYLTDESEDKNIIFDKTTNTLSASSNEGGFYDDTYTLSDGITRVYKPLFTYKRSYVEGTVTTTNNYLDIYVVKGENVDLNQVLTNIQGSNSNYADGNTNNQELKYSRTTPFILFTHNTFYAANYSANGTTTLSGNYNHMAEYFNIQSNSYNFKDDILKSGVTLGGNIHDVQQAVFNNFLKWCDSTYIDPRTQSTWITFGIYCGVNGSIMLLMGIIIWLMTRGKNNPNNKTKIWEAYSMGFWAAGSPALLSLLGFLMPQLGMMLFIMLYAFRIMFLSMKQLRPVYQ